MSSSDFISVCSNVNVIVRMELLAVELLGMELLAKPSAV